MIDNITKVSSLSSTRGLDSLLESGSNTQASVSPGENAGLNFASVLGGVATDSVNSLKFAEAKSFEAIQGTASTREVVDAVIQAQQTLNTAIALRDKIVNAYLEVTKMSI
ncbi:MAG TPA: flagellar hook-basal body complex protein FliE [Pseudorhizobium sp.]|jgi:flagellar hook-basal body complex protein FliE|nr:flagellar hook-basal body complex protein FliE [Pseudorhizobium sp.]